MPHAILEYSSNINYTTKITESIHKAMIQSDLFKASAIKTRALKLEDFFVGEKGSAGSFVHVTIYLLQGRSVEQKQILSDSILAVLQTHLIEVDQLSVNIQELSRDTYRKYDRA